jgi:AraC family transcriptional regulator
MSILPPIKVRRIKEYMEANLSIDLRIKAVARVSGYSQTHFLRMFRASTGATPHQYLIERRICRAQELIGQATVKLAEIAVRCGFSSQSHLATVFRKRVGMTPTEYRRAVLKEKSQAITFDDSRSLFRARHSWSQDHAASVHSLGAL